MRKSNRGRSFLGIAVAAALVAACGGTAAPSVGPSTSVAPAITADPHLSEPVSVDDVLRKIVSGGLRVTPNTASTGTSGEPVKRVNATYANWPLVLTQFSTSAALREEAQFDPGRRPVVGESPYILAGLNIMLEFGPHSTNDRTPAPPTDTQRAAAEALVAALHPLIGPLQQRSTFPLDLPGAAAAPPAPAESPEPSTSPAP
jgi:hypothetical protein